MVVFGLLVFRFYMPAGEFAPPIETLFAQWSAYVDKGSCSPCKSTAEAGPVQSAGMSRMVSSSIRAIQAGTTVVGKPLPLVPTVKVHRTS